MRVFQKKIIREKYERSRARPSREDERSGVASDYIFYICLPVL